MIPAKTEKDEMIRWGIMAFFILLGMVLIAMGAQPAEKHKALVMLRQNAANVVWVYIQRNKKNGQHIGSQLMLGCSDGALLSLPLTVGKEDEQSNVVREHVPHALFGYDAAIEARFKKAPASLQQ